MILSRQVARTQCPSGNTAHNDKTPEILPEKVANVDSCNIFVTELLI